MSKMNNLIDREELIKRARPVENFPKGTEVVVLGAVKSLPTVDAEPVVHAHWEEVYGYVTPGGDPVWVCSNCGKGMHVWGVEASTYNRDISDSHQWVACPNCGAKMDGKIDG